MRRLEVLPQSSSLFRRARNPAGRSARCLRAQCPPPPHYAEYAVSPVSLPGGQTGSQEIPPGQRVARCEAESCPAGFNQFGNGFEIGGEHWSSTRKRFHDG